jgi:6-phosphofructokinase 2
MIVTVTPNPSLDRSAGVAGPIVRGQVHRLNHVTTVAAGKGVNVSRALHNARVPTRAVVPAGEHDPLVIGLKQADIPHRGVPIAEPVRTNLTVTEPDGTTTKFNEPGAQLTGPERVAFEDAVLAEARGADWVVMTGSLPPGLPDDWYVAMTRRLRRETTAKLAIDTSDAPLRALAEALPDAAPDVIKPNSTELAQLCGAQGIALEAAAAAGDFAQIVTAANGLVIRGISVVLVTLGAAGALLVTEESAWRAVAAPISVGSTVGAGDSSLAGLLIGLSRGDAPAEALRNAVAWGTAAAALPGSTIPTPELAARVPVTVTPLGNHERTQPHV